jgi:hypothetical protein
VATTDAGRPGQPDAVVLGLLTDLPRRSGRRPIVAEACVTDGVALA